MALFLLPGFNPFQHFQSRFVVRVSGDEDAAEGWIGGHCVVTFAAVFGRVRLKVSGELLRFGVPPLGAFRWLGVRIHTPWKGGA